MARANLRFRQGIDLNLQGFSTTNNNYQWVGGTDGISYGVGDIVVHNNQLWVSTTAGNDDSEPAPGNDDWTIISSNSGNLPDTSHFFDGITPLQIGDQIELVGTDLRQNSRDGLTLILQNGQYNLRARVQNSSDPGVEDDVTSIAVGTHVYVNQIANVPGLPSTNLENVATVTHNYSFNGQRFLDFSPSRDTIAFLEDLTRRNVPNTAMHTVQNGAIYQFSSEAVRIDTFIAQSGNIPIAYDPVEHRLVTGNNALSFTLAQFSSGTPQQLQELLITNLPSSPLLGDRLFIPGVNRNDRVGYLTSTRTTRGFNRLNYVNPQGTRTQEIVQATVDLPNNRFILTVPSTATGVTANRAGRIRRDALIASINAELMEFGSIPPIANTQAAVEGLLDGSSVGFGDTNNNLNFTTLATPFHTNPDGADADGEDGYNNLPTSTNANSPSSQGMSHRFYVADFARAAFQRNFTDGQVLDFLITIQNPSDAMTTGYLTQRFYTFIGGRGQFDMATAEGWMLEGEPTTVPPSVPI